jgi:hypothetical protein
LRGSSAESARVGLRIAGRARGPREGSMKYHSPGTGLLPASSKISFTLGPSLSVHIAHCVFASYKLPVCGLGLGMTAVPRRGLSPCLLFFRGPSHGCPLLFLDLVRSCERSVCLCVRASGGGICLFKDLAVNE